MGLKTVNKSCLYCGKSPLKVIEFMEGGELKIGYKCGLCKKAVTGDTYETNLLMRKLFGIRRIK